MRARRGPIAIVACSVAGVVATSPCRAEEPFEPASRTVVERRLPTTRHDGFRPVTDVLLAIVRYYQREVGVDSVSRCPFAVSCSVHATIALERYGVMGLPLFLDRYFFRENADAYSHYRYVRMNDGGLRLDDAAFDLE